MQKQKRMISILLSFLVLLSCVFGNAAVIPLYAQETGTLEQNSVTYVQITDLSTISADEQYVLVGWRYFGGTDPDATKGYVLHSDNNGNLRAVTSDSYASITYAENGGVLPDLALWNLTGSGETFTIRNVSTKKYLGNDLSFASEEGAEFTFTGGSVNGCANYAIGVNGKSIRYSGTSGKFGLSGGAPATEVTRTNACNFTIYKVQTVQNQDQSHSIFFASDYQGSPAEANLTAISKTIKEAGVTPEVAVWCGDYVDGSVYEDGADVSPSEMMGRLGDITGIMTGTWPGLQYLFLQGNHDYSGFITDGTLTATGPQEYDDYIIYIINEDDFPWWQGVDSAYADSAANKVTVQRTADKLEDYLGGLIANGCKKPVMIATHVPLSWSARSTTGATWWMDNIYADVLFEVINDAARKLDIVYLFGHNHSDGYDNYIGGSINYLGVGDVMRVPNGTNGTENYENKIINFTYANAGYIGKTSSNLVPSVSTASILTITEDVIRLDKYATSGFYPLASKTIERCQYGKPQMAVLPKSKKEIVRKEGDTEVFHVLTENQDPLSYTWTSDQESVQFVSGADQKEVTVQYHAAGDITLKCTVSYRDEQNQIQQMERAYQVTVKEQPNVNGTYKEITDLSELTDQDTYVLVAWRYFAGTNSDSTKGYVLHSGNNGNLRVTTEDRYTSVQYEENDGILPKNAQWNIEKTDNGYTIQNVDTEKYIGNSILDSDVPVTYTITKGTLNGCENFALSYGGKSLRYSGTSGTFSNSGSDGAAETARANACNFTIYKYECKTHQFGEWKIVKEPGWEQEGEKRRICEICHAVETEMIPKLEKLPFVDIAENAWYVDAVRYVYQHQIMSGMDETHFAPEADLSRGQFAVVLYQMAGKPEVDDKPVFEDVKDGEYYTNAVMWANANGIVTGYGDSGLFGPNDRINREQMVTMLFRYAKYLEADDLEVRESYDKFPDGERVSAFASEAMEWAVGTGIISGYEDGRLAPQDYTNRAVCAAMVQRFLNK